MFKVTERDVYLVESVANIKANVNVTIGECFVVTGITVRDGKNGLFVQMPQVKKNDGTYKDTSFPISKESRDELVAVVMEAYQAKLDAQ